VSNETAEVGRENPVGALGTSLKPRHITMISIAGVIGAGLFVGSKNAIKEAGPPSSSRISWRARWWSW
jgi:GABA permease